MSQATRKLLDQKRRTPKWAERVLARIDSLESRAKTERNPTLAYWLAQEASALWALPTVDLFQAEDARA